MGGNNTLDDVRELRHNGYLSKAYDLGRSLCKKDSQNLWYKRDFVWVCYDLFKKAIEVQDNSEVLSILWEIANLDLNRNEMVAENLPWKIGEWLNVSIKSKNRSHDINNGKIIADVLSLLPKLPLQRPSKGYSFLASVLHKNFRNKKLYCDVFDVVGLDFFIPEDYKNKVYNNRHIMSLAEQVFVTYAKCLICNLKYYKRVSDMLNFDRYNIKVEKFLSKLDEINLAHKEYKYLSYLKAKLFLAIRNNEKATELLVPVVRKMGKFFWPWALLGDTFMENNDDMALMCYCRALLCQHAEKYVVNVRDKIAALMAKKRFYDAAKTEYNIAEKTRMQLWNREDTDALLAKSDEWYDGAKILDNNVDFYKAHAQLANSILFKDYSELVLIVHLNSKRKIAYYLTADNKIGFFKYGEEISQTIKEGCLYEVFFLQTSAKYISKISWGQPSSIDPLKTPFYKTISGSVRIFDENHYGFIGDVFVNSSFIDKFKLVDGTCVNGIAIRSYNKTKNLIGWRCFQIN